MLANRLSGEIQLCQGSLYSYSSEPLRSSGAFAANSNSFVGETAPLSEEAEAQSPASNRNGNFAIQGLRFRPSGFPRQVVLAIARRRSVYHSNCRSWTHGTRTESVAPSKRLTNIVLLCVIGVNNFSADDVTKIFVFFNSQLRDQTQRRTFHLRSAFQLQQRLVLDEMTKQPTPKTEVEQDPSVTRWLYDLREGDKSAATRLWKFLNQRLLKLSKNAVARTQRAAGYDEDDVAQSAFIALCTAIQSGRYEHLADRSEVWKLLAVITLNKAKNRAAHDNRLCRGGGRIKCDVEAELQKTEAPDLSAEEQLVIHEECERLLGMLQRDELKRVAILKVEGHTNEEVAERLACSRRSVQRRLNLIREIWASEIQ